MKRWCRLRDLNSRPTAYKAEFLAFPVFTVHYRIGQENCPKPLLQAADSHTIRNLALPTSTQHPATPGSRRVAGVAESAQGTVARMAREKLTDKRVSLMKPPATGRREIFDTVKTGLCFRITTTGAKSWSVMYRHEGHFRRQTLGPYPKIGLAKARQMAGQVLETSGQGTDPRSAKAQEKATAAARAADTVEVIAEQFIGKYASQRRWGEFERILRRDVMPEWGEKPITTITRRDVIELLDTIAERAPVQANRTLVVLKVFFGWALDRDVITADPTARVKKPTKEKSRDRVLSDAELRAFWLGCERLGWPFGEIWKLLALTAARKSVIVKM